MKGRAVSTEVAKPEPPADRPAAWYVDETNPKIQRWWSGESWSEYTRPTPQPTPPGFVADVAEHTDSPGDHPPALASLESSPIQPLIRAFRRVAAWWRRQKVVVQLLSASAVVAVMALLAVVVVPSVLRPSHHFQGVLTLSGDASSVLSDSADVEGKWDSCSGTGGYSDFAVGAPATIRDGEGNIVGQLEVRNFDETTLGAMLAADATTGFAGWGDDPDAAKSLIDTGAALGISCHLYVEGEVKDSDFYSFTFSHRGELSYSREQLAESDWWVALSLGG